MLVFLIFPNYAQTIEQAPLSDEEFTITEESTIPEEQPPSPLEESVLTLEEEAGIAEENSAEEITAEGASAEEEEISPDEAEKIIGEGDSKQGLEPAEAVSRGFPDFFIAPLFEVLGYSRRGMAFGGGIAIGAGNGIAIGLRLLYALDTELMNTLEIAVFMRAYIFGKDASAGPFAQLNIGSASFGYKEHVHIPSVAGTFSIGLGGGWRFILGQNWYIEPTIRLGYPYILGGGISGSYRFGGNKQ